MRKKKKRKFEKLRNKNDIGLFFLLWTVGPAGDHELGAVGDGLGRYGRAK